MEPQDTLTPAEFARRTGLSLGYVYSLLWTGRLDAEKSDGNWSICASELERAAHLMPVVEC